MPNAIIESSDTRRREALRGRWSEAPQGKKWDIVIIGAETPADCVTVGCVDYIRSMNDRLYTVDGLKESVERWGGIKVYDNHLTDAEFKERAGMRSFLAEGVGILTHPRWDAAQHALMATLEIVDDAARQKLINAHEQGVIKHIGLSIDTHIEEGRPVRHDGKEYETATGFEHIFSLDIVSEPAAGGKFKRVLATQNTEGRMPEFTESEMETLRKLIAGDSAQEVEGEITAEDAVNEVADAVEEVAADATAEDNPATVAQDMADAAQDVADEVAMVVEEEVAADTTETVALKERLDKMECRETLRIKLDAAKLPVADRRIVEAAFAGRIFKEAELSMTIKRAKEAQAARDKTGSVSGGSGTRGDTVRTTLSPKDKAAIGLTDLMGRGRFNGGMRALEHNEAPYVQERMPTWYKSWINAGRPNYRPRKLSQWLYEFTDNPLRMRATEANDVSAVTQDAVNVFLAAAYSVKTEWWEPLVTDIEVDTIDDVNLVVDYGLSELSLVLKGAAYTAIDLSDDEETASFVKFGNYVELPIEDMLLDKLNIFQRIPQKLANSWYNTLSKKVANVFTLNSGAGPVLGDTGALFNATATTTVAGHANLLTTALSYTGYSAVETAMMKQTDQKLGAGERLLIRPNNLLVPVDLRATALQIRNSEYQPGTADNNINPYYNAINIVEVPSWSDTNNWATVADKGQFPSIHLVYVNGYRVPQVITAGDKASGAMFTNDTMRWKVQLFTYQFSSTYDCAPVADWRPLHKSNVT